MTEQYLLEFTNNLLYAIQKKYGITDEDDAILYMKYRYCLIKDKENVDCDILYFILHELDILQFIYVRENKRGDKEKIVISDSDLFNIYLRKFSENFDRTVLKIIKSNAKINSKNWINNQILYESYQNYFKIYELNQIFNAVNCKCVVDFLIQRKPEDMHIMETDLTELLHLSDETTKFITENDLEEYLIWNLSLIEDGLKFIQRQYVLEEGRIDILARDKYNNLCIIELKISDDKKIIWQCLYYELEIKKRFPNENIRVMTIMKEYPDYLLEPLSALDVEMFEYDLIVKNNVIQNLNIRKAKKNE